MADNVPPLELEAAGAFLRAVGMHVDEAGAELVRGHLDVGPDHHTPWAVVHGGVYTTVIESTASIGASLAVAERDQFAVGVSQVTDFLRPHYEGRLDVTGTPVQQGRTLQLWLVEVTREDGKTVARGHVRLQNVPLPARA